MTMINDRNRCVVTIRGSLTDISSRSVSFPYEAATLHCRKDVEVVTATGNAYH